MAEVAFAPVVKSIADAHGVRTHQWQFPEGRADFAAFLRSVAHTLDNTTP